AGVVVVDGEAAGVDVSVLLVAEAVISLSLVSLSRRPLTFRCSFVWNSVMAALVLGPILPSIGPGLKPLSIRACWALLTSSSPFLPVTFSLILSLTSPVFSLVLSQALPTFSFAVSILSLALSFTDSSAAIAGAIVQAKPSASAHAAVRSFLVVMGRALLCGGKHCKRDTSRKLGKHLQTGRQDLQRG